MSAQNFLMALLANSSKLLKNHLIAGNLTEVKSSSLAKWFFKSLGELAKCHQKFFVDILMNENAHRTGIF